MFIIATSPLRDDICPPLQPDGGGFWYLKRKSDGAILMRSAGRYMKFASQAAARRHARGVDADVEVRWMPALRAN